MSSESVEKIFYLDEPIGHISPDGTFDISTWIYPTLNAGIKVLSQIKMQMIKMNQEKGIYPILLTYHNPTMDKKDEYISLLNQHIDYMEEHRSHPYIDLGLIPLIDGSYEDVVQIDIDKIIQDNFKFNPAAVVISLRKMKPENFDTDRIMLNKWKTDSITLNNLSTLSYKLPESCLNYALYDIMVKGQWGVIDIAVTMFTRWGYYAEYLPIPTYSSKRPKTTMPFIGIPEPINRQLVPLDELITVDDVDNYYCPVVRYGSGMSGTYYLAETEEQFCGTFYYLEPESEYLLRFGSYKVYRNKYSAFMDLITIPNALDNWAKSDPEKYEFFEANRRLLENFRSSFAYNFIETALLPLLDKSIYKNMDDIRQGYIEYIKDGKPLKTKFGIDIDPETNIGPNEQGEMIYHTWLYASEDDYDQPICNLARGLDIDVIILTTMAGKTRVVTEVLDTRPRDISYKNIFLDVEQKQ